VGPTLLLNEDPQDMREYAAQKEIEEQGALGVGMKEKAEEFVASGGEIYSNRL
jgi:phosphomethylpyrimidine synthase